MFLAASRGQVRFDVGAKNSCFDILLVELKMNTSSDASKIYCDC
jgi:hypothetical protein